MKSNRPHNAISVETEQAICERYTAGDAIARIAAEQNVGQNTVLRCVRKHDLPRRLGLGNEQRFVRLLSRPSEDECWEFQGSRVDDGYGLFKVRDDLMKWKTVRANRYAYALWKGPIPPRLDVMHTCDNPPCCNPKHLILGTNQENRTDSVTKGRAVRGERQGKAKLTAHTVIEIREKYHQKEASQEALASLYGVTFSSIGGICRGESWRHVGGPLTPPRWSRKKAHD